jgi:predicted DNA binding CopG/RHH family protein
MKPVYDMCTLKWRVKGLGLFDTPQEAKEAIQNSKKKTRLNLRISEKTFDKLQERADSQSTTVSEVVRQIIEKEVGL